MCHTRKASSAAKWVHLVGAPRCASECEDFLCLPARHCLTVPTGQQGSKEPSKGALVSMNFKCTGQACALALALSYQEDAWTPESSVTKLTLEAKAYLTCQGIRH